MLFILLLCVLLAWLLCRLLFSRYWQRGLSVSSRFRDSVIYEGDTSALSEIVVNDKLMPISALEVRLAISRNLEFMDEAKENSSVSDQSYRRDVFSFLFHQRVERTLRFCGVKRGYYELHEADLIALDFFFRTSYYKKIPLSTQLYIYPGPADAKRIVLLCQAVSGTILSRRRLFPDPFEFAGLKEYRREDPMNHINWKASAKSGSLMVNQFDSTTDIALTLLLDLEDTLILKYQELLEESIRITASLAMRLVEMRMPIRVKSDCADPDTEAPLSLYLPAGSGNIHLLNQKLARIDTARTAVTALELISGEISAKESQHTYIFLSKNHGAGLAASLRSLAGTDNTVLWVLPFSRAERDALPAPGTLPPQITLFPWEMP